MFKLTLSKNDNFFDYNFEDATKAFDFAATMIGFGYILESIYMEGLTNV